ncbi:MAG TPA: hypothetical protein VHB77_00425 [Planctomycetaceae bacterium]|nr:hypothetical protein [Planctomycetaceae bacterium]
MSLALINRSLLQDNRSFSLHVLRGVFLALIFGALCLGRFQAITFGAPGKYFFELICYVDFWFISLAGVSYFASAITEEKEEMTLGLLRMAGISPVGLLLGKSTSRLVGSSLLLWLQFPFALFAVTLGGLTSWQILAAYVVLFAYMVFVANLALWASVISHRTRGASWATGVLLGLLLLGPWVASTAAAGWLIRNPAAAWWAVPVTTAADWADSLDVISGLRSVLTTGFDGSLFGNYVWGNFLLGAFFFGLAWVCFDRYASREVPSAPPRGLLHRTRRRFSVFGVTRPWREALVWKDFHFVVGGRGMALIKLGLYLLMCIGLTALILKVEPTQTNSDIPKFFGDVLMFSMIVALMVEAAFSMSHCFRDEIQYQTLSTLMLLPRSDLAVCTGKLVGCFMGLLPGIACFCLGACLDPQGFKTAVWEIYQRPEGWFFTVHYFFFLHLVLLLSLVLRWGSLAMSFLLVYVGGVVLMQILAAMMMFSGISTNSMFWSITACELFALPLLQVLTVLRVRALALR